HARHARRPVRRHGRRQRPAGRPASGQPGRRRVPPLRPRARRGDVGACVGGSQGGTRGDSAGAPPALADLAEYGRGDYDEATGLEQGAKSVKDRLKELGTSGKSLGALAGLGAGAAVAAGLAGAMELEPAKAKLTAQLGLTKDESKRIGGVAGSLYSGAYGDSM